MILNNLLQMFIGFGAGIVVGGGFVAFITVLNIISRLTQLTNTYYLIKVYSASIVLGLIFGTMLSLFPVTFNQNVVILIIWGTFHGIFNGMLAAALTEVLNVFPILSKRVGLEHFILWFLMAIIFGKVFGSLFQWLYFV